MRLMAIEITETFQVKAPVDAVWRFMLDPQQVVTCMPGAQLEEVVDDRTFVGSVKVKLGAITTSYKGRVQITEMDEQAHTVKLTAEGRETGGGTAKGTLHSQLQLLPDGQTEVSAQASVDLTGRVMQMGRGMIKGVSHQLFQQFVVSIRERLEVPPGAEPELAPVESAPIRAIPLLLSTLRAAIARLFRRLFGSPKA
jgi:hypothetical protein